jgi:hypothetical protein
MVAPSSPLADSIASADAPPAPRASATLTPAASWSAPVLADQVRGGLASISCPSTSFCLTIDGAGNAATYDGASWSTPRQIVPRADVQPDFPNGATVSCASPTFCVAVLKTASGGPSWAESYDGAAWSGPVQVDVTTVTSISCAVEQMCVAVDSAGDALVDQDGSWAAPVTVDAAGALEGVSCSTASSCMAVGWSEHSAWAFAFDGASWSRSAGAVGTEQMVSVSCAASSGCVAVNQRDASTFDGSSWSTPTAIVSRHLTLEAVSCGSATACLAITSAYGFAYDGSAWSGPRQLIRAKHLSGVRSLSCPTPTWCDIAMSSGNILHRFTPKYGGGYVLTLSGSTLSKPVLVNSPRYGPNSLSCPTPRFCAVLDWYGYAATRSSTGWGSPFRVTPAGEGGLQRVSCVSPAFCLATGGHGDVYQFDASGDVESNPSSPPRSLGRVSCVKGPWCLMQTSDYGLSSYDGESWSPTFRPEAGFVVYDQSCLSPAFCMVVGYRNGDVGAAAEYANGQWSDVTPIEGAQGYLLVACGSPTFCIATDEFADTDVFDGTSWSASTNIEDGGAPQAVACSPHICIVTDDVGEVTTYRGGSWQSPVEIDPSADLSGASCPNSGACVVVSRAGFAYTRQSG